MTTKTIYISGTETYQLGYGADSEGQPWCTFEGIGGYATCAICGATIRIGWTNAGYPADGSDQYICASHVERVEFDQWSTWGDVWEVSDSGYVREEVTRPMDKDGRYITKNGRILFKLSEDVYFDRQEAIAEALRRVTEAIEDQRVSLDALKMRQADLLQGVIDD